MGTRSGIVVVLAAAMLAQEAQAQDAEQPNILVIMGDDIGWYDTSAYNEGVMGYRTSTIDSIAEVHLDGYKLLPNLAGEADEWPRREFFAFVDDGTLGAVRHERSKFHFSAQEEEGMAAWVNPPLPRKAALLIELRADPFEMAPADSSHYDDWLLRRMHAFVPLRDLVGNFMATFEDSPPRQEIGSFTPKKGAMRGSPGFGRAA